MGNQVNEFLSKSLDNSNIHRFHDGSDIHSVTPIPPLPKEHDDLWWKLHFRVIRLHQFIKELSYD